MIGPTRTQATIMLRLPLAVLEHTAASGRHYDLLVADPRLAADDPRPLWAARVALAPADWADARALLLEPIPHHRAHYLRHQGPIGGRRGRVRRVAAGHALPRLWRDGRIEWSIEADAVRGMLSLRRRGGVWVSVFAAKATPDPCRGADV